MLAIAQQRHPSRDLKAQSAEWLVVSLHTSKRTERIKPATYAGANNFQLRALKLQPSSASSLDWHIGKH